LYWSKRLVISFGAKEKKGAVDQASDFLKGQRKDGTGRWPEFFPSEPRKRMALWIGLVISLRAMEQMDLVDGQSFFYCQSSNEDQG
jgi:hypothetical protein